LKSEKTKTKETGETKSRLTAKPTKNQNFTKKTNLQPIWIYHCSEITEFQLQSKLDRSWFCLLWF